MKKVIAIMLLAVSVTAMLVSCQTVGNLGKNLGNTVYDVSQDVKADVKSLSK